jgi:hypothetical protein
MSEKTTKKAELTPPDTKRCQAEKPNGATFMSLGGVPKLVRCTNKPTMIATEKEPGKDGQRGSMSLCDECFAVFQKQAPVAATFERITPS